MNISVVILTLNEAHDLPTCLESLSWCDDIVVFDSYSSDKTTDFATAHGARVYSRTFDDYASQRNAALTTVEYKHDWVLMVDADERWPKALAVEIQQALDSNGDENSPSLFHFRRKDMFYGRWLRRSTGYPTWSGRLAKLGEVQVDRKINEEYQTSGTKGFLNGHFIHYPFSKGIAHWLQKHNRYSTMEAEAVATERLSSFRLTDCFAREPIKRRKALKQLAFRLPGRPLIVFLYLYFFRLGFIDGRPGLTYCTLRMMYEYMIDIKVREIRRKQHELPV